MGRLQQDISTEQQLANKINGSIDFTHYYYTYPERYVVGLKNLYTGKNPSIYASSLTLAVHGLNSPVGDCFGGWLSEDGVYFVDISTTTDDLDEAMAQARERDEIAIYDNVDKVVIMVK